MDQTKAVGGGRGPDERRGRISQRTYMHDPWTETMVWGLPEGWGWAEVGKVEKGRDHTNSTNYKIQFLKKLQQRV